MEDVMQIAVAGYRQVCGSENDSEYSDHGEKWSDSEVYTSEMMSEKGKPVLGRGRMTTEQSNALHAEGMAGDLVTVSGKI
jgi:hypothetical protein